MKAVRNSFTIRLLFAATLIPLVASAENQSYQGTLQAPMKGVQVSVVNTEKNAVPVKIVNVPHQSITHLNVSVGDIVNLESECVRPDNSLNARLFYDGNALAPFVIPEGYSFVVTDIIAQAGLCTTAAIDPSALYLALVESPRAERRFSIRFRGDATQHYALSGGLAFPSGEEPRPRNTAFSASSITVQVLGYFVEGEAVRPPRPRF